MTDRAVPVLEELDHEVEPKLKYMRLSHDLQRILDKDAISTVTVHPKFICLGTYLGRMHLFDHIGNIVEEKKNFFPEHKVAVNQISVDAKGEYVGTCSDDGMVTITGLYSTENNQSLNFGKSIKCIALDPKYHKSGSGRRFVVGDTKLTLYEKTFLKSTKSTVLCDAEGSVSAIAWSEQFVAWASVLGVRVYDLNEKCSLGLIRWEELADGSSIKNFRCNLRWASNVTLLIGWVDTIRICVLRKRIAYSKDLPGIIIDPISTFRTDFYVCGLVPLENNEIVVLGMPKEKDPDSGKSLRPHLCVLQYKSNEYVEICTDSLSMRGYQEYKTNDYSLEYLPDENQFFIVSPKDIIIAGLIQDDERVEWYIEHRRFEQAMQVIASQGGRYSLVSVARLYLDHLLDENRYEEAAQLCRRVFGTDIKLWEEEIYKFVKIQQLRSICPYLPHSEDCKLNPHIYEIVLYEYLKWDPEGFLELIRTWDPSLYNSSAVRNAIESHINEENEAVLLEAMAILYGHEKMYDAAVAMYLKLRNRGVFKLIQQYQLYDVVQQNIVPLLELDTQAAMPILLNRKVISPEVVVQQLQAQPEHLLRYLDGMVRDDATSGGVNGRYHWLLITLYAQYDRKKLLSFLKRSQNYPIQEAYELCRRENLYDEQVYLLEKMGNTVEALHIIVKQMNNMQKAINFCKDHNDLDLWNDLIKQSLENPATITQLLDGNVAGYINPEVLVNDIPLGQRIPGLKGSLIKMLTDYSLQVTIQGGCNKILATDYFDLHERLVTVQQRALAVRPQMLCAKCDEQIFVKDVQKVRDVVMFNCHHIFHESCLNKVIDFCVVCKSKKAVLRF